MNNIKSFEGLLRAAPTKDAFLATLDAFPAPDVMIDHQALASYAAGLRKPVFISDWEDYRTPGNDLETDFVELAVSTVQQGGYLYAGDSGETRKWEIGGSGAKALLAKMDEVRRTGLLPAIHLTDRKTAHRSLRGIFNGTPYARERIKLWHELCAPGKGEELKTILRQSQTDGSGYHFGFNTLKALAKALPQGFGEDPFLKKAALLTILFAGVAHKKLAPDSVTLDVVVPMDYRVPQTLHNIGILRFSDHLVREIDSTRLMADHDPLVAQIRTKTGLALHEIETQRPDLQMHHLDGELWFAGRLFDVARETLDEKKGAIRDQLEAHGYGSGFRSAGFRNKTGKAMNVASLRF